MKIFNGLGIFSGLNKKAIIAVVMGFLLMPFLSYATIGAACSAILPCSGGAAEVCSPTTNTCVAATAPGGDGAGIPVANPGRMFADIDFLQVVTNIAELIIGFIAILGIIFLVYGGILYVTSAGDESRAEDGKRTITYAMIGLFLAASAYAIEKLILVTIMKPL